MVFRFAQTPGMWNPGAGNHYPIPTPTYPSPTTCSGGRIRTADGSCVCPPLSNWDPDYPDDRGVPGRCMCVSGAVPGAGGCRCEWAGTVYDPRADACVCANGGDWNEASRSCNCPAGTLEIDGRCIAAEAVADESCADQFGNSIWDEETQQCTCPAGFFWGASGACVRCRGVVDSEGNCVACAGSTAWNDEQGRCVPVQAQRQEVTAPGPSPAVVLGGAALLAAAIFLL